MGVKRPETQNHDSFQVWAEKCKSPMSPYILHTLHDADELMKLVWNPGLTWGSPVWGPPACERGDRGVRAPTRQWSRQSGSVPRTAAGNAPPPESIRHRLTWPPLHPDLPQKNKEGEALTCVGVGLWSDCFTLDFICRELWAQDKMNQFKATERGRLL